MLGDASLERPKSSGHPEIGTAAIAIMLTLLGLAFGGPWVLAREDTDQWGFVERDYFLSLLTDLARIGVLYGFASGLAWLLTAVSSRWQRHLARLIVVAVVAWLLNFFGSQDWLGYAANVGGIVL